MNIIENIFAAIFGPRPPKGAYIAMHTGIDFSLRSAAACLYDGKDMRWILFPTGKTLANKKMFERLTATGLVDVHFGKVSAGETYSEKERAKVLESICLSNRIGEALNKWADDKDENAKFFFAFEGTSFGSKGNSLVDTAMSVGVARARLASMFGVDKMHIFAPTSVKKYMGSGKLDKVGVKDALILRPELPQSILDILADPESVSKAGKLAKPLDDMCDSAAIALFLYHQMTN